jgi:hypothetical protein
MNLKIKNRNEKRFAFWTAAVLRRFSTLTLRLKSARGLAQPKTWRRFGWLAATLVLANVLADAQQQSTNSAPTDFSAFQIISQRNIFDPNRYPRTVRVRTRINRDVVPTFSLAGTMSYRKGMFAFFDGTSSVYRRALQEGGTIAGYTVTKITLDGAQLESGGKKIEMQVGAAMRQEGDGWQLSAPGEWSGSPAATETENENSSPTETAPAANAGAGGDVNDILKRMMQQREQELK